MSLLNAARRSLPAVARSPRLLAPMSDSANSLPDAFKDLIQPRSSPPPPPPSSSSPTSSTATLSQPPSAPNSAYSPSQNPLSISHAAASSSRYHLHVLATRNNTVATFTNPKGNPLFFTSGGACGFKGANKSTYEAGYQVAVKMFRRIEQEYDALDEKGLGPMTLQIIFKGTGQGRDACYRAMMTGEGERVRPLVAEFTDRTPIKIGGTRSKKIRRT